MVRLGAIGSDYRQHCDDCHTPGKCTPCKHCVPKWLCVEGEVLPWDCDGPTGRPEIHGHYAGEITIDGSDYDVLIYYEVIDGECSYMLESVAMGYTVEDRISALICDGEFTLDFFDPDYVMVVAPAAYSPVRRLCNADCTICSCVCSQMCVIHSTELTATAELIDFDCGSWSSEESTIRIYLEGDGAGGCQLRATVDDVDFGDPVAITDPDECQSLFAIFIEGDETITASCTHCAEGCNIVNTPCCPEGLPRILYAVFEFPDCDGVPVSPIVVPIIFDGLSLQWQWSGDESRLCDLPPEDGEGNPQDDCEWQILQFDVSCAEGVAALNISSPVTGSYASDSFTCDPVEWVFTNVDIAISGVCGLATVTILEAPP